MGKLRVKHPRRVLLLLLLLLLLFKTLTLARIQTFGQMTMGQKAEISHRGHALRLLKAHLLTLV